MSEFAHYVESIGLNYGKRFWKDVANHTIYITWLGEKLGYKTMEDWYKITQKQINDNGGCGLLKNYYNGSPYQFVKAMFPDYEWIPWKFVMTVRGYWIDNTNHTKFAIWLGEKLGYKIMEDWYKITIQQINDNGGCGLLSRYYNGSPSQFVKAMFPEYEWIPWKFDVTANGYWKDNTNHTKFVIWLGEKLGYKTMEDWYKITIQQISDNGGCGLLKNYYNSSPSQFVKAMFPDYEWIPWKFDVTANGYWKDNTNHTKFAIWLGEKLGYKTMEDWYKITWIQINDNGGSGLLGNYYHNSPSQFVKSMFTDYEWILWKFDVTANDVWNDNTNHTKFTIWLGEKLGYKTIEDWYKITWIQINDNHGGGLLGYYYHNSPSQFVKAMFPDYEWIPWKFDVTANGYWKDNTNHTNFVIWLGKQLGYKTMEDWYKITVQQINDNHGCGLLGNYYHNSPSQFVKAMFPDYEWIPWKFDVTASGVWKDNTNHTKFSIWLGEKLGYKTMEDWYKITKQQIADNYGCGLLGNYYNGSPSKFVKAMFPDYEWVMSKFRKCYSVGQIQWLEYSKIVTSDIRHILNHDDGEFNIPNSRYRADGYSDQTQTILEYHGDFWHGNPDIYDQCEINPCANKTYGELFQNTCNKKTFCEDSGYNYVYIWESEWMRGIKVLRTLQKKIRTRLIGSLTYENNNII